MWRALSVLPVLLLAVLATAADPPRGKGKQGPKEKAPRVAPAPTPAPPAAAPLEVNGEPVSPEWVCRKVAAFALRHPDAAHLRFVSWHATAGVDSARQFARYWLNSLHFSLAPVAFRDVPGTGGLVWWFDLREPGWSAAAWSAVARRDGLFTDIAVGPVASELRRAAGLTRDPQTLSVEVVVWGPQLVRDTLESQRNPSYYDLLYSRQRFGAATAKEEWQTEKRVVYHPGGDYRYPDDTGRVIMSVAAGNYNVELRFKVKGSAPAGDKDFPTTTTDLEKLFAVRATGFALGKEVKVARGALVAGATEDPRKGSVVARSNRWVEMSTGSYGWFAETYDVAEAAGKKDFFEQAPFLATGAEPVFDATELLATLPGGGIAAALGNGKRARIEVTDPNVTTRGPSFKRFPHLDHGAVRNPGDCLRCHLPEYGVISPTDMVRDALDAGLDLKFQDPADAIQFRGFFRGLRRRIAGYQEPHRELIEEATAVPGGQPWTGARAVEALEDLWGWYDSPVSCDQAAAEVGVTPAVLRGVSVESLSGRAKLLVQGVPCPRPAWDRDVRPLLVKLTRAVEVRP